jgi:two-component system phosphate regulon sensor histidine kinase PhoR
VTITRLSVLSATVTLAFGLVVLGAVLSVVAVEVRTTAGLIGLAGLIGATVATGIGVAALIHRFLEPFRRLARAVAIQGPLDLRTFSHSDLEEVASIATAVQGTQSRLTSSMAQAQRDRSDMAALFEHMADGVLVLDAQDRVELANPAAGQLLRQSSLHGRPLTTAVRDPDVLELVRAARGGSSVRHPVELHVPNRRRSWLQVIATPLPTERRILVLLQDISELRHAEAVRRDFVANVSHELKTPVASLKALVETLEAGALDDPECGPDFLRRMHVEVDGLAQLVTELLELARIEAGRLDLDLRTCRVDQLVRDATERIRPYATRVGLDVSVGEIDPDLEVQADSRQIGQVLSNLLSNAVKFTPPGGQIELGARRDDAYVELWVSDSGVGIATHELHRVFERFYKSDPSRTESGTGLGLAICKHVVQAHGGLIYAESDGPGRGATFRFTLPAAGEADASEAEPEYQIHTIYPQFKVS